MCGAPYFGVEIGNEDKCWIPTKYVMFESRTLENAIRETRKLLNLQYLRYGKSKKFLKPLLFL